MAESAISLGSMSDILLHWNALQSVDFKKPSFLLSAASIVILPSWWNIVSFDIQSQELTVWQAARAEYKTKWLSKLTGSAQSAVYVFSASICTIGLTRDYL